MENSTLETYNESSSSRSGSSGGSFLLVFYCFIFIVGLVGNSMVIYVAIAKKNYRNVTNCYIISLAIADLLFLTLSIPYTTFLAIRDADPFGNTICKIYTYLAYGFLQATCSSLAVMSIDRYLYIVQPKSKLVWRTPRNALKICLFIWTSSFTVIIPYHIISRLLKPTYTTCGINEHENLFVCLFPFCSYYAFPLLIIIICYTNLALHVIRTGRNMAEHMNKKSYQNSVQLKQRRVTRMVIVVTLAFAICWAPIHVLELTKCANPTVLIQLINSYPQLLYGIRVFTHALAYLNSCINPYLYALLNRNFCNDLAKVIPFARCCCQSFDANNIERTNKNKSVLYSRKRFISARRTNEDEEDEDEPIENIE